MRKRAAFTGSLIALAVVLAGYDDTASGQPVPPISDSVEVGVVTLTSQSVTLTSELPGRVLASATAEIRPQVDGIVRKQVFEEGSEVKEGDILYELDAAKFRAALDAAAATLLGAQALEAGAQATFDRIEQLVNSRTASAQSLDDARTALLQAQAGVASAQAAVAAAQINLDNTVIRAPIPGRIGISTVSVGSLVTANQTSALATIRQIDPVNVDLADSSANRLRLRALAEAGVFGRNGEGPPTVTLVVEDGSTYSETGTLSMMELAVSETTGSFTVRAVFANPRRNLRPGMFVRATIVHGSTHGTFLVPQRAVTRNAAGEATAFFLTGDNKAERRILKAGQAVGNDWLVTAGVSDGDRLIVDGLQMISDGSAVTPVDVVIDADGVIRQTIGQPGNAVSGSPVTGAAP